MRVHHLFYSADVSRQTLHRRISPTVAQREIQQGRWQDLRDYLIAELGASSRYPMSSWLQGSYKFGTQIRPAKLGDEFDIDLGLYYEWRGGPTATGEPPVALKAKVQAALNAYAFEAADDVKGVDQPAKERCSRIRFTGDFHIDVPTYHLDRDRDARDLATETGGWEESDPKALYLWFRGLFDTEDTAQVRRLIRYIKMWAALRLEVRPASVLLTVLVAEAYLALPAQAVDGDDLAMRNVAQAILNRLNAGPLVLNPSNLKEDLNRLDAGQTKAFIIALSRLVDIADAALTAPTQAGAILSWTEAFAHFFPASTEQSPPGNALVAVAFDPHVSVEARPKNGPAVFRSINGIGPIPKECSITFTLDNAYQLPAGAEVRWTVRNEGEEAELINDMGHIGATGPVATENSAYRGTHFMDVMVVSALGAALGFRRIPVQISGMKMPLRNPSRPGWARGGRR